MTGIAVFVVVFVLLTTRTRRGRRNWGKALGAIWLLLAWSVLLIVPRSSRAVRKQSPAAARHQAPTPAVRVTRKSRGWPEPPWRPKKYAPGDDRPGQGPRYFTREQKDELLRRAGYQCQHAGPLGIRCHRRTELRADHLHPYSWGGKTILENGQILCDPHNVEKGAHWTDVHDPALLEIVCVPHMLPRNRFGWGGRPRSRKVRA